MAVRQPWRQFALTRDHAMRQFTHPEENLQEPATRWLVENRGYEELVSDIGALGARVDSIGLLDGRLYLIEVKTTVAPSMVSFDAARAGSLEAKISSSLRSLYEGTSEPTWNSVRARWTGSSPPVIAILARKFGSALDPLVAMLKVRGDEWGFDHVVWAWDGASLSTLGSGRSVRPAIPGTTTPGPIPVQVGRARREPSRSIEDLQALADKGGTGPLFAAVIREALCHGLRIKTGRETLTLSAKASTDAKGAIVSINALVCDEGGLNFGYDAMRLRSADVGLPGAPGRKVGFMMSNRLLRSEDDVRAMFAAMALDPA